MLEMRQLGRPMNRLSSIVNVNEHPCWWHRRRRAIRYGLLTKVTRRMVRHTAILSKRRRRSRLSRVVVAAWAIGAATIINHRSNKVGFSQRDGRRVTISTIRDPSPLFTFHMSITQIRNRAHVVSPIVFVSAESHDKFAHNDGNKPLQRGRQLKGQEDGVPQLATRMLPTTKNKTNKMANFRQSTKKRNRGGVGNNGKNNARKNNRGGGGGGTRKRKNGGNNRNRNGPNKKRGGNVGRYKRVKRGGNKKWKKGNNGGGGGKKWRKKRSSGSSWSSGGGKSGKSSGKWSGGGKSGKASGDGEWSRGSGDWSASWDDCPCTYIPAPSPSWGGSSSSWGGSSWGGGGGWKVKVCTCLPTYFPTTYMPTTLLPT